MLEGTAPCCAKVRQCGKALRPFDGTMARTRYKTSRTSETLVDPVETVRELPEVRALLEEPLHGEVLQPVLRSQHIGPGGKQRAAMRRKNCSKSESIESPVQTRNSKAGIAPPERPCTGEDTTRTLGIQQYRSILDFLSEAVIIVNREGNVSSANKAAADLMGSDGVRGLIAKDIMDFIHPDDREAVKQVCTKIIQKGGVSNLTDRKLIRLDGGTADVDIKAGPLICDKERCVQMIVCDITSRKLIFKTLEKGEQRYRSLFNDSRDPICVFTCDGDFVLANSSFLTLFDYDRSEILKMRDIELYVDPVQRYWFKQNLEKYGHIENYEAKLRTKDGSRLDCLLNSSLWLSEDKSPLGYQCIISDVTEIRRARDEIRRLDELLRSALESLAHPSGD